MIKLLHGDCIDILHEIPDNSIDLIIADEPYGATKNKWDYVIPQKEIWEHKCRIIKKNGAIIHFGAGRYAARLIHENKDKYKHKWFWKKSQAGNFAVTNVQPLSVIEEIPVFTKSGERATYYPIMRKGKVHMRGWTGGKSYGQGFGDIKQVKSYSDQFHPINMLEYPVVVRSRSRHPSEKPVALLEYLIHTYSKEGETVLDYCMGSGSTGEAAINTKRQFIGIEKDQKYFDIAKERIEGIQNLPQSYEQKPLYGEEDV